MMKLKHGIWVLALAIIGVVFISGCIQQPSEKPEFNKSQIPGYNQSQTLESKQPATAPYIIAFTVKVPENTPQHTVVFLEFVTDEGLTAGNSLQMERKVANVWGITLKELPRNKYRYNRNEWSFTGAEEFYPDSKTAHRTITSGAKEFNDVVKKWRWMPESDYKITEISTKAKETTFVARVGNEKFQKGIEFSDFWSNSFKRLLDSTHASLKKDNVEWIEISPAWKCAQSSPTPLMRTDQYSDETINFHLNKTKEDGFKILLVTQLICDTGKNPSDEWWNAWFAQYENYTMYFVDLANKYGIETLVVSGDHIVIGSSSRPANYKQRLEDIYLKAKQRYKGKFGRLFVLGGLIDTGFIWPNPKDVPFMENWDFMAVNFWISQTTGKNPTQEELYSNVKTIFEKHLKPLYDSYKKPIILAQVAYPSIDGGLAGVAGADDPATAVWEPYSDKYVLDLEEQAMGHEAIMKNAAETNYIIGTYAFAYWPDDFPLTKEYNVRGKPTEEVLSQWYKTIP